MGASSANLAPYLALLSAVAGSNVSCVKWLKALSHVEVPSDRSMATHSQPVASWLQGQTGAREKARVSPLEAEGWKGWCPGWRCYIGVISRPQMETSGDTPHQICTMQDFCSALV